MDKPLIIEINEAKMEITSSINQIMQAHRLPCYLVEPMVYEVLVQLQEGARNELQMAKNQLNNTEKEEG